MRDFLVFLSQLKELNELTRWLDENANLTDCYWKKKDWRACKEEVAFFILYCFGISPTNKPRWEML